jgi:hypothetical protein
MSAPTSIRSTVHLLVDPASEPQLAAHVEQIMGQPVVFLTLATEQRTSSYTQSIALSFSGHPDAVRELLKRTLAALDELSGGEER